MDRDQQPHDDRPGEPGTPGDGHAAPPPLPPHAPGDRPSPYGPTAGFEAGPPYGPPAGYEAGSPYGTPGGYGAGSPYGPYGVPAQPSPSGAVPYPSGSGGAPMPRPGTIPLVPLTLADLLGGSFATIRRSAAATLGTSVLVAVLEVALVVLAMTGFLDATLGLAALERSGIDPVAGGPAAQALLGRLVGSLGLLLLAGLAGGITTVLTQGVLSVVALRAAAGLRTSLGQAWRLTGRQAWSLAGLGALYGVVVLVAVAMLLAVLVVSVVAVVSAFADPDATAPGQLWVLTTLVAMALGALGLWLAVRLLLAPSAAAVEQHGPFRAIGRSWSLTRGHWWRTLGVVLLVSVVVGVVSSVVTTPLSMAGGLPTGVLDPVSTDQFLAADRTWLVLGVGISALVNAVARAYTCCVAALLYVDYRIRHERLDLELGAAAERAGVGTVDRPGAPPALPPTADTADLVPGRRGPAAG
ncbi:hypothetical protein E7744_05690 [Citricoccus sp. SGAir0253]|uniref:glycerophosphoryl diester phosphodiesterase membrane domain-containing protein n=1 Tax=Citricoccus sp. SGAir0253 TaxID=2567881 RepID=UPI0010CD337C|nr:glycerophosphoryl diester phosphodiesterase membrane domain-containing protein [Citricoccus sp. SGAir0253]QCU77746.1 hypothetical protein E7744_05690 [Citricoccus sp. SGAir0253]